MSSKNINIIVLETNYHIVNINRLLKNVKSDILTDFICSNNKRAIITTNKIAVASDINIMKKYIKELEDINSNNVISFYFLQFKLYLKNLEVLYYSENTLSFITYN